MFNKDFLQLMGSETALGKKRFRVWSYQIADRAGAEAARNQPGYFPEDEGTPQVNDVVYVIGGGTVTHHWVTKNPHTGELALQLFGG